MSYKKHLEAIEGALRRGDRAEAILDRLLDWAIANRQSSTDWKFVRCHAYHGNAFPAVLIDALKFMGEPVKGLRRAKE